MTDSEMAGNAAEMAVIPDLEDNTAKYYTTKKYMKKCVVCGRIFYATADWAYKIEGKSKWFCCYTHYVQGGGDGGMDRVKGKRKRSRRYGSMAEKISPLIELLNRKDAEIAKLKEELVGAREEIVMLHKNLSPEEQAMMRAAMDRAFEEERE